MNLLILITEIHQTEKRRHSIMPFTLNKTYTHTRTHTHTHTHSSTLKLFSSEACMKIKWFLSVLGLYKLFINPNPTELGF